MPYCINFWHKNLGNMFILFKGELHFKTFLLVSQANVGNNFLAKTRSRYDNGKLLFFEGMCFRNIAPLFVVISDKRVHQPLHCTCALRAERIKVDAVPVQKILHWRLLFSRMREQSPVQGLCLRHVLVSFLRGILAGCMHLTFCIVSLEYRKKVKFI